MITALSVAKAYAAAQKGIGGTGPDAAGAAAGGADFGAMVRGVVDNAIGASKSAEQQIVAHAQGKAQLIDVATAVSAAETSLETVMAVRDQVISAYQEIMRMPI
ncbi:flagellar hook-basal body complex protein FliE [Phenylobacterium parvum]|jgi:flagellar hook-basal body complex protein FliE|uniref:Flagellar hook-basal body complex protein FliE n=1 Tax=Phenylobacterium parvum TaxID=2201350 RepID=A0A2Z3HY84_9CAUL|nr:flagellar hook-basal body complex protein FliE [Phenylobacterium parvum]AWM77799.1 flagellar hook-basal body complex protein FliE [Phenylobacterium parvum]